MYLNKINYTGINTNLYNFFYLDILTLVILSQDILSQYCPGQVVHMRSKYIREF